MSGEEDDCESEEVDDVEDEDEEANEEDEGDAVNVSLEVGLTIGDGDSESDDDDDSDDGRGGGGGGGGNRTRGAGDDDDDDEEDEDSNSDDYSLNLPSVVRGRGRGQRRSHGGIGRQGGQSGWGSRVEEKDDDDDSDSDKIDIMPSAGPRRGTKGPSNSRARDGQGAPRAVRGVVRGGRRSANCGLLGDSSCSSDGSLDSDSRSRQRVDSRKGKNPRGSGAVDGHRGADCHIIDNKSSASQARGRINTSSYSNDSPRSSSKGPIPHRRVKGPKPIPVVHPNSSHLPDRSSYVRSGADVVHQYAQLYFKKVLSPDMQKRARKQIKKMDTNGDGKVVLQELLRSFSSKSTKSSVKKLFKFLDMDNNGFLNFEECITVFYLQQVGYSACKLCEDPIFNSGYSCQICWDKGAIDGSTFDVCIDCYTGMRPSQHSHKEFVDMHVLHTQTSKIAAAASSMVQCISCGDFHNKNISSYLVQGEGQMHVNNEFVCEWCRAWPCINCGKYIQAPASAAKPKMFLNASYYCRNCKTPGSLLDMSPIIRAIMNNAQLQDDCATCAIKIRTGDLFAIPMKTAVVTALVNENSRSHRPTNGSSCRPPQRRGGQQQGGNSLATVSQIVNNVANVAAIGNNLLGPLVGTDADCDIQ